MSKRTVLIFIAFILCSTTSVAQKINADNYIQFLNYANCKYTEAYLQEKNKPIQQLSKVTIDTPLSCEELCKLLNDNKCSETANKLSQKYFDNRKDKFSIDSTDEEIIKILELTFTNFSTLPETTSIIVSHIKDHLQQIDIKGNDTKGDVPLGQGESYTPNSGQTTHQDNKTIATRSNFFLFFAIIGLAVCAIVRWKFWDKIKGSKNGEKIFYGITIFFILMSFYYGRIIVAGIIVIFIAYKVTSYFIKRNENGNTKTPNETDKTKEVDYKAKYKKLENQFNILSEKYNQLQKSKDEEIRKWEKKYKELEEQNRKNKSGKRVEDYHVLKSDINESNEQKEKIVMNSEKEKAIEPSVSILYADAIIDGFFYRVKEAPNEDTIFELHLQNAQITTFTIYHSAKQRIVANPSFIEGCDRQVLANAQDVKIESEGTAMQQADGRWKIIKKLNAIIN